MKPAGIDFNFQPRHLPARPEWRAVEHALARWVLAHGGDALLARMAAEASLAEVRGDSAVRVEDGAEREALAAMPWVGAGAGQTPFVLEDALFYLRRNHRHEVALAERVRARLGADAVPALPPAGLFPADADERSQGQRLAVAKALGTRLFVLSGGPGTGKTHTVLRMLMAQVAAAPHLPQILLAAPTGKAAQRLAESLHQARAADFPPQWHEALAHVQKAPFGTVHRLLGSRGRRGGWQHDRRSPLPADIVVIDEASMLDLALLRALLEALPGHARLILVGDADQLDAVGTGSVLQDVVTALGEDSAQLQRLVHSFRAERALLPLNEAVRRGDAAAFAAALAAAPEAVQHWPLPDERAAHARLDAWAQMLWQEGQDEGITAQQPDDAAIARCLQGLRRRQWLCALREGVYGVAGANARIEARLLQAAGEGSELWYPGRRILITRNDSASGLFNGDVGLCLRDAKGRLRVWFEAGGGAVRGFEINALPPHESAFALTVHKAQGSEYEEVAIMLPAQAAHPLLSRQWLYTAISRAKKRLQLCAEWSALEYAIGHRAQRIGGLARKIAGPAA